MNDGAELLVIETLKREKVPLRPSEIARWSGGRIIAFEVRGVPITQGSKVAGVNPHTGKAFMREGGGSRLTLWRHAISDEARKAMNGDGLMAGAVDVTLRFGLQKPKSAPKTRKTWPVKRGLDVDKAARAALDALTGVLFADDSQVVRLFVSKDWSVTPGVAVSVWEIPE